ncbi:MAG: alpha/beta fold hydrolase [Gemmatimonadota bacterium]|nr:alpha/beta fold hydrolase [Gemmatimonadota bacterium]
MTNPRWARVREIFHEALDSVDPDAYVADASGGDEDVEREVRKLLDAHAATGILPRLDGEVLSPAPGSDETGPTADGLDDMEDLLTGALAGRYEVERRIGAGGMAAVYLARDLRHGRDVAIKVLKPRLVDREGVDRFLREIRLTARLHHPHILPLFDSGEVGGTPYYVMPFVDGSNLAHRIREAGQLPVGEALGIAGQVASALDFAHAQGVVHRDVKPGNVLLRADATFVSDFGIGFALEAASGSRITDSGVAIGTPSYMSPEQVAGDDDVDERTDVYALACMVYEMLAGEPPFTGRYPRTVMLRHVRDTVPHLSSARPALGPAVDAIFQKALAKSPADRFATSGQFVQALSQTLVVDPHRLELGVAPIIDRPTPASIRFDDTASTTLNQKVRICTARDGVKIAWARSGSGPPLVKAANWLSHLEHDAKSPMWRHWWSGLSRHHTLIRYDERGQGLSDREAADISFEAWVADLEAVVDAAGLDRFTLLGVSKGGAIATAYAHRHPERVERMVLLGAYPQGRAKAGDAEWATKARVEVELVKLGWGQANPAFRQVFSSLFFPDADPQRIAWFNELQRVSATPENAARIMEAAFDIDVAREARELTVPTLILHSQDEERVPVAAGRYFASLIPGAEFVPLPSRNHIPLEHEPAWKQFLEVFEEFTARS